MRSLSGKKPKTTSSPSTSLPPRMVERACTMRPKRYKALTVMSSSLYNAMLRPCSLRPDPHHSGQKATTSPNPATSRTSCVAFPIASRVDVYSHAFGKAQKLAVRAIRAGGEPQGQSLQPPSSSRTGGRYGTSLSSVRMVRRAKAR